MKIIEKKVPLYTPLEFYRVQLMCYGYPEYDKDTFYLGRKGLFTYLYEPQIGIEIVFNSDLDEETKDRLKKIFLLYEERYPDFSTTVFEVKPY